MPYFAYQVNEVMTYEIIWDYKYLKNIMHVLILCTYIIVVDHYILTKTNKTIEYVTV